MNIAIVNIVCKKYQTLISKVLLLNLVNLSFPKITDKWDVTVIWSVGPWS